MSNTQKLTTFILILSIAPITIAFYVAYKGISSYIAEPEEAPQQATTKAVQQDEPAEDQGKLINFTCETQNGKTRAAPMETCPKMGLGTGTCDDEIHTCACVHEDRCFWFHIPLGEAQ